MKTNIQSFRAVATYFAFTSFDVSYVRDRSSCAHSKAVARILHKRIESNRNLIPAKELCLMVEREEIHLTSAIRFLNSIHSDLRQRASEVLEDLLFKITSLKKFITFLKKVDGCNVSGLILRIKEEIEIHQGKEYPTFRSLLRKLGRGINHLNNCEIRHLSKIIATAHSKTERKLKVISEEFADKKEMIGLYVHLYDMMSIFNVDLPNEGNSQYTGEFRFTIYAEETKAWAASQLLFVDKEELNKSLGQILIEVGELAQAKPAFTEGEPHTIQIIKDGFKMAKLEYIMVCRGCGHSGGGKCPECGPSREVK